MEKTKDDIQGWELRLIEEYEELYKKWSDLKTALNSDDFKDKVDSKQLVLLNVQYKFMNGYVYTLRIRLQDLGLYYLVSYPTK